MSEPVIKPVMWRCACDRRPCLGLQMCREAPPTPLYGPDALVLAFAAGAAIGSSENANETIDLLTKGET